MNHDDETEFANIVIDLVECSESRPVAIVGVCIALSRLLALADEPTRQLLVQILQDDLQRRVLR